MAAKKTKPCGAPLSATVDGPTCTYLRKFSKTRCAWHWLLSQPIEVQIRQAGLRLQLAKESGMPLRDRVSAVEWPEGERWCSGCQAFVPLFYASGSRCKACTSKATHAAHVERTYEISREDYDALLAFQGGRCWVCGQVPRGRRLAVDHDHATGKVRGLLCSGLTYGCNVSLARVLNDVEAARRLLEYVELSPLERMRDGEQARVYRRKDPLMDSMRKPPPTIDLTTWSDDWDGT